MSSGKLVESSSSDSPEYDAQEDEDDSTANALLSMRERSELEKLTGKRKRISDDEGVESSEEDTHENVQLLSSSSSAEPPPCTSSDKSEVL